MCVTILWVARLPDVTLALFLAELSTIAKSHK